LLYRRLQQAEDDKIVEIDYPHIYHQDIAVICIGKDNQQAKYWKNLLEK